LVIQFGAALTSKAFHAYTARHPSARHVIVDPGAGWRSPARRAREVVTANPTAFAEALSEALAGAADPLPSWREEFERAERAARVGATIVVVHNDGGGIFSFLPVARHAAFERYFGTPHGLDFAPAAAMYGTPYSCPRTWEELRTRAAASLRARATEVIEVRTE